ncbi:Hypothetical_protein [Hexamita inflata]|uniref:Hypothetical_protein n=1 Tax=Hexamita inflata TaxID=28002 RepID=A0AA86Q548_9EUKA|nr:Hypothetical protein HINF_LOCUS39966 [Hexamita inflata]
MYQAKFTQTDDQSMIQTGVSPSAACPDSVYDSQREFVQQEPTAVETQKQCRRNASFESKFEGLIFAAIKEYFTLEQFQNLRDALLYQRQYTVGAVNGKVSRVSMNFQKIAVECELTEKQCKDKFQQLVAKELSQPWPEETVAAVKKKIEELWQLPSASDAEKKSKIKTILEDEFKFKQKVQHNRQDMANIINYKIKQLEK